MAIGGTFQTNISGSAQNFAQMATQIAGAGISLIPSVEYNATPPYLTAVQRLRGRHAPGVMVKVGLNQLRNVLAWVTNQNWNPGEIDLVVTLGEIANFDPGTLIPAVINTIQNNIQNPSPWRTITLSSSSAPQDHGGLAVGRNDVPRLEWEVWSGVVAAALPYQIDYADYSTVTPDLTDPPGYVMSRATVSVRYTIDDYWIILKGRPTTGRTGQAMGQQYRAHGRTLVADRSFGGLVGCWTDGIIQQIANGTRSAGGRAQWAGYAANRHLSFIANRLP
jgi:hypothetical protein